MGRNLWKTTHLPSTSGGGLLRISLIFGSFVVAFPSSIRNILHRFGVHDRKLWRLALYRIHISSLEFTMTNKTGFLPIVIISPAVATYLLTYIFWFFQLYSNLGLVRASKGIVSLVYLLVEVFSHPSKPFVINLTLLLSHLFVNWCEGFSVLLTELSFPTS